MAGGRAGRQHRKIVVPARGAYRLFTGGDCRGIGFRRRAIGGVDVCLYYRARICHRAPSGILRAAVCRAVGAWAGYLDRGASHYQHGRKHGLAADQGVDFTLPVFWRQRDRHQLCRAGDFAPR